MVRTTDYKIQKPLSPRHSKHFMPMQEHAEISIDYKQHLLEVNFSGTWKLSQPLPDATPLLHALQEPQISQIHLQAQGLDIWDSSLLAVLVRLIRHARAQNCTVDTSALPHGLQKLLDMSFRDTEEKTASQKHKQSFLQRIGQKWVTMSQSFTDFFEFFGEVCIGIVRFFQGKADLRFADFWAAVDECGARSLGIVSLTSLLFGLILAFVGAIQLTQFGAERYVAPLVAIGTLRVMGAIMVGIVMSGRIGAAYAALIGTMQVNEEVDALKTFGFSAIDFLVLPRIFALVCMTPLLTLYADFMGIVGGFLVGVFMLNLTPQEYISATISLVPFVHLIIGLIYGTSFGFIIAIAGCYQGIRCGRSAAAVGQATTAAVVNSIVGIIISTAIITIICNVLEV